MLNRGYRVFPLSIGSDENRKKSIRPLCQWRKGEIPEVGTGAWAEANAYGIPCDGMTVVDLDVRGGDGIAEFRKICEANGQSWPVPTFTVKTASGGMHLYFRGSAGKNSVKKLGSDIDIRTDGGMVIGPGSVSFDGSTWTIETDLEPIELPRWLRELTSTRQSHSEWASQVPSGWYRKSLEELASKVANAPGGSRNDTLNQAAFVAFTSDRIDDDEARERLREAGADCGLDHDEVTATLNSAYEGAQRQKNQNVSQQGKATTNSPQGPLGFQYTKLRDLPDKPITFTIDRLLPEKSNFLFSAQAKAGKTTEMLRIAEALTTRKRLHDEFHVERLEGNLVYVNFEMDDRMLRNYAVKLGLDLDNEKLMFLNARGQGSRFRITDDDFCSEWARDLTTNDCEFLVIDPLAPLMAMNGYDSDNNDGARLVLERFSMIGREAGISHVGIVDHAGHMATGRARGASAKQDWPDVIWNLQKSDKGQRKMKAYGRGVEETEFAIEDDGTVTFAVPGAKSERPDLMEVLRVNPGASQRTIATLAGCSVGTVNKELQSLEQMSFVEKVEGKYYVATNPPC
ncbi:MAG: bifunctional DNA primase/polymerase [Actinomycetota bacterium]|nr:bifunctional DNA primase/polymerase [Actinomycetota bacterium]